MKTTELGRDKVIPGKEHTPAVESVFDAHTGTFIT